MKIQQTTELHHYTKETPYLLITLSPQEAREVWMVMTHSDISRLVGTDFMNTLKGFCSEYDSGKYDKYTLAPVVVDVVVDKEK